MFLSQRRHYILLMILRGQHSINSFTIYDIKIGFVKGYLVRIPASRVITHSPNTEYSSIECIKFDI